jgi:hypothetical protein
MIKIQTFLLIMLVSIQIMYSQDTIVSINGHRIACEIQRIDSFYVYYTIKNGDDFESDFIKRNEIQIIKYKSNQEQKYSIDRISLGLGMGLDYGGIGGNAFFDYKRYFGFLGGVGYDFTGFGYNVGCKYKFIIEETMSQGYPYLLLLYGINTVIDVTSMPNLSKRINGLTIGLGFDYKFKAKNRGYWSFGILAPIRDSRYTNYIKKLKNDYGAVSTNDLWPISFSFGYRYILNRY